jgi:hypothetical protein
MSRESTQDVINLVVTCTNRKCAAPISALKARNLRGRSINSRRNSWALKLTAEQDDAKPAAEVYKGDHWSVVRSIGLIKSPTKINVWIASAGYGLISPASKIVPYAATLSPRHEDSVAKNSEERRAWWAGMIEAPPISPAKLPKSLQEVARKFPSSPLVVAASSEYIDAMTDDILGAQGRLDDPSLLSILCRKGAAPPELREGSITLRADLSTVLGGALTSLNARVLRWLVVQESEKLTAQAISRLLAGLACQSKARVIPKRTKLTDDEVKQQIYDAIETASRVSKTALLKTVRESGLAVEQRRFARIYNEVLVEAVRG